MANNVFKVDNGLTVSGGDLRVVNANAVDLRANTSVTGDASVSANLAVTGNTSLARTTISGNFLPNANGRVLGDTTSTFDTHTGNNVVYGRLNPVSNGVQFGTSTLQWDVNARDVIAANSIVVAGVVTINSLGVSATTTNANNVYGLTTTGIVVRTGSATGNTRTITGSNTVTVTNGDGVAGNPTIAIPLQSGLFSNTTGIYVNASSIASGVLPLTYGGTGAASASAAFSSIITSGTTVNTTAYAYNYILSTDNAGNYVWATPNPPPDTASSILSKLLTVDGSSSNLDADLLDGYNTSTSDTASTVAVRDASGYLYATYFNQTAAAETPTIGNVIVTNTTDGFYRKISNTNFISGLGLSTQSYAAGQAATAYANAVSYTNTANTAMKSYVDTQDTATYNNATLFAANASNISSGTLAEARLPFRMNQNVRTTDTVTFGNMTVTGDLTVSGTTTYINTTTLNIGDNIITLNADLGLVAPTQDAGFEVNRGSSPTVSFLWDETNDRWTLGSQNLVAASFIGALSGNATTATTLQTARNINGTSFNGSADITTANWGTTRTITIGSTGKSVNGSGDYSWTLGEIGAAAVGQTMYVGTTALAINRASLAQTLTGVSIDGNAGTVTNGVYTTGSYSDPTWLTLSKSKVGLSNVDNTADANKNVLYATSAGSVTNSLTAGSYLTGGTYNGGAAVTFAVDATNLNTASKIVARDISGNFSAGTITATLSGTATQVSNSLTAGTGLSGTAYNGSAAQTWSLASGVIASPGTYSSGISGITVDTYGRVTSVTGSAGYSTTTGTVTSVGVTAGSGLTGGGTVTASGTITLNVGAGSYIIANADDIAVDATNLNTASKIVARDASGNFSAGTITATLQGNASTATSAASATTAGSVTNALTAGTGLSSAGTYNGSAARTFSLASGVITTPGTYSSGISAITVDTYGRVTAVTGSAGYTTNAGTVTSITAGSYLTGGTITSSGTLAVDATNLNTASKIVARDASGNFSAGTITATLSGTATQVSNSLTAGTGLSGTAYNGSAAQTWSLAAAGAGAASYASGISAITVDAYGRVTSVTGSAGYVTSSGVTSVATGTYMTGGTITSTGTIGINANTGNIASTVVARDASGNFSAGTITATLSGSATSAGSATTAGSVTNALTAGEGLTSAGTYNGSAARTFSLASSIAGNGLTYTTGVVAVGAGNYITVAADSVAVDATTTATASKVAARDSLGDIYANDFQATSDARLKTDIIEIQNALDTIEKINGVKFKWNELATNPDKDKVQVGVIAQEVEAVVPEIVNTNDDGYKSVSYDKLVPLLIQAVKELSEKVKKLEGK